MPAGSATATLTSDIVPNNEDLSLYLPPENYGFTSGLFKNGPTASHSSPAPTKIKARYQSEEEDNEEDEDEEEDDFDNGDEDDDSDGAQFEQIDHQAMVPYAGPPPPQSYADDRRTSPKRRRITDVNGYSPIANSRGPQYMLVKNQAPQMNNSSVGGRGKRRNLRQVQSASNLGLRSQVTQARLVQNTPARSFQTQMQMPGRNSLSRREL